VKPEGKRRFHPDPLYNKIVKYMSISSVEAIIVRDGKLLFLRRKNNLPKDSGSSLMKIFHM
jgi:hypothetical protein